jgi:preprotein translocase subunit SecE
MASKSKKQEQSSPKTPAKAPAKAQSKATKSKAKEQTKKVDKKPSVFKRIATYFHEVRLEIKRTTWPTKNEVLNMSIIVVAALIFFGVLIFLLDWVMTNLLFLYSHVTGNSVEEQAAAAAAAAADSSAVDPSAAVDPATAADPSAAGSE